MDVEVLNCNNYVDPWELLASSIITLMARDYLDALKENDEKGIRVGKVFFESDICDKYLSFTTITKEDVRNKVIEEFEEWKGEQ